MKILPRWRHSVWFSNLICDAEIYGILFWISMIFIQTIVTTTHSPSNHPVLLWKTLQKGNCVTLLPVFFPFLFFFEPVSLFNAAFVGDVCFYTFRTVAFMSHKSVSEPFFPQLKKIMSVGTWGRCLGTQPGPSNSPLLQHLSTIQW